MSITENVKSLLRERIKEAKRARTQLDEVEANIRVAQQYAMSTGRMGAGTLKELYEQRDNLKNQLNDIRAAAKKDAKSIVAEHRAQLEREDSLNSADLNEDFQLLSSGLPLMQRDVEDIIARNSGNRTIVQLALRYAEAHNMNLGVYYEGNSQAMKAVDGLDHVIDRYVDQWLDSDRAEAVLEQYPFEG